MTLCISVVEIIKYRLPFLILRHIYTHTNIDIYHFYTICIHTHKHTLCTHSVYICICIYVCILHVSICVYICIYIFCLSFQEPAFGSIDVFYYLFSFCFIYVCSNLYFLFCASSGIQQFFFQFSEVQSYVVGNFSCFLRQAFIITNLSLLELLLLHPKSFGMLLLHFSLSQGIF